MAHAGKKHQLRIHLDTPYEDDNIVVHFVGDDTFDDYRELNYHTNPGYEICLIPYGKGVFKIQENAYPIGPGQIFITKEPQLHAGWPSKENPYRILYICFHIKGNVCSSTFWGNLRDRLEQIDFPVSNDKFNSDEIHHRLLGEILSEAEYAKDMIYSLIQQFVVLTLRNFTQGDKCHVNNSEPGKHNQLAERVIHFIDGHIYDHISLDDVASALNYSISYLCRHFKEQTGFTVMEYYNFARLERAKKLLTETGESVSGISEILRYNSIHHFSNSFKSLYGCSPNQYRKMISEPPHIMKPI